MRIWLGEKVLKVLPEICVMVGGKHEPDSEQLVQVLLGCFFRRLAFGNPGRKLLSTQMCLLGRPVGQARAHADDRLSDDVLVAGEQEHGCVLVVGTGQQEAANGGDGFEHLTCRQAVDVIDGDDQSTVDGLDQPGKTCSRSSVDSGRGVVRVISCFFSVDRAPSLAVPST